MTEPAAAISPPKRPDPDLAYQPGLCNIGPSEIARRRRSGYAGVVIGIGILAALILVGAPPLTRLLVALPAAVAASGYLQARLHFCAGFGSRGVFNFGPLGAVQSVAEVAGPEAALLDRRRSLQISLGALVIGLAVGIVAVLLPV